MLIKISEKNDDLQLNLRTDCKKRTFLVRLFWLDYKTMFKLTKQ